MSNYCISCLRSLDNSDICYDCSSKINVSRSDWLLAKMKDNSNIPREEYIPIWSSDVSKKVSEQK